MIGRIVFYLLLLLLIYGVVWVSLLLWHEDEPEMWKVYEGRLCLAADEYEQFNQYLADNPEVLIVKLDVWASPNNALIVLQLNAPADIDVPYGEVTQEYDCSPGIGTSPLAVFFQLFLCFVGFGSYLLVRYFTIYPRWIF